MILPIHKIIDDLNEKQRAVDHEIIGTTKKGIGPAYEDKVGRRAIRLCDLDDNKLLEKKIKFLVNKTSSSPSIGVKPKPLQNLTIKDVIDVNQITSSIKPDLDLYTTSVSEAIDNGRPTIITFASPSFCRTATCGPQLEIISSLNAFLCASRVLFSIGVSFLNFEIIFNLPTDDRSYLSSLKNKFLKRNSAVSIVGGSPGLNTVSYTHLTLPTNREV